ncbi:MAG: hypothetical protein J0L93_07325 [Deltaproteobacteria bacterium]|nr:hypothetical protein [Deltaproteobacteria bacterium]
MKWAKCILAIFFAVLSLQLSLKFGHTFAVDSNDDFEVKKNSIVTQPPEIMLENIIVEDMKSLGSIVGSYKKNRYLTNLDTVYLKMPNQNVSVGDRFMIYNDLGGVKVPGSFMKKTGKNISIKGFLQVSEVTPNTIVAKIYDSNIDINIGDLVAPISADIRVKLNPQEPTANLTGMVLSAAKDVKFIGPYEFAFINKGSADGLKKNDRLFVYRTGDGNQKVTKELPQVNIAELIVANVSAHHATAYCTGSSESFEEGSTFKTAKSEVRYLK